MILSARQHRESLFDETNGRAAPLEGAQSKREGTTDNGVLCRVWCSYGAHGDSAAALLCGAGVGDECGCFRTMFRRFRSALTPSTLRRDKFELTGKQHCADMPSPNSDTRAQVVVAYQGHPVFVCAQCATVIVRGVFLCIADVSLELTVTVVLCSHRHSKTS